MRITLSEIAAYILLTSYTYIIQLRSDFVMRKMFQRCKQFVIFKSMQPRRKVFN